MAKQLHYSFLNFFFLFTPQGSAFSNDRLALKEFTWMLRTGGGGGEGE